MQEDTGKLFSGPFFTLEYPEHWASEIIEDVPAFYDPEGGGALQVIAARNSDGYFELRWEMTRYLSRHNLEFSEDNIAEFETGGGYQCIACEFMAEDRFWMIYMLAKDDKLIMVLYNSDAVPNPDVALEISSIIQSISIREQ